ncbi:DUF4861 domain-containing protein [Sungkyunkwania multivorans]|uniref:DUF4861 domain-containing protein n=1 Tax=Sungkyunkwania multivorans TaxID=1173618 RepID=A0ABW3CWP1_9FLAO
MKLVRITFILITIVFISSNCSKSSELATIEVANDLDVDRSFETVEVDLNSLDAFSNESAKTIQVVNKENGDMLLSQLVDTDGDGTMDVLLFQPEIKGHSKKQFTIIATPSEAKEDSTSMRCYSRFVPERTDDYAWENNRVAFRTFGPTAQKMKEDGVQGGTLSSGIDAWLKRVEYPIIDKWYKKHTSGAGSYHEDSGEGLDNFHVGVSRGVGGTALKTDSTYAFSKNFIKWKTITNGPIRTSFVLDYASWDAEGKTILESKHISLDYGQNLSKFVIEVKGTDTLSVGMTLHKKDGNTRTKTTDGWMSYWEPFDDSELGQGLVIPKGYLVGHETYMTDRKDESNLYAHLKVKECQIEYYAGFGWKKSGQFETEKDWHDYLSDFSRKVRNPLKVTQL